MKKLILPLSVIGIFVLSYLLYPVSPALAAFTGIFLTLYGLPIIKDRLK